MSDGLSLILEYSHLYIFLCDRCVQIYYLRNTLEPIFHRSTVKAVYGKNLPKNADQKSGGSNSQKEQLLPSYPPRVGYGLVGGPYSALGAGNWCHRLCTDDYCLNVSHYSFVLQSELMALMRCLNLGKEARKNKPTIGLSLNPMLAQPGLGSTQSTIACFSGLSTYEMGEPSSTASPIPLVHSVTPTTIPSDIPKSLMLTIVVSNRQVEPPMLVSRS
nr:hypothetical protein CFP56_65295 [Quercus suber]